MQNFFDELDARLSTIEALLHDLSRRQKAVSALPAAESRYGNFDWYIAETGEAKSTARQRIARGEVPGVTKLGKRLLFDKETVRHWIKDNQRKTVIETSAEAEQVFNQRHASQRGKRVVP